MKLTARFNFFNYILPLLFLMLTCVYSQDKLILNNGDTLNVKVITVDEKRGIVSYIENNDTVIADLKSVSDKDIRSEFTAVLKNEFTASSMESENKIKNRYSFFDKPAKYNYGKFLFSTNITSLLKQDNSVYNTFFALNSVLSLQPEIFLSDKFSIMVPVLIGLNKVKPAELSWFYSNMYDTYNGIPSINDYYFTESYSDYGDFHPPNLLFQVGFYTKHFGNASYKKNMVYFSQGLSVGKAELYAIDFYHHFVEYQEPTYSYYNLEDQYLNASSNTVFYFRYEIMLGLLMKLNKNFNLSFESGFSSRLSKIVDKPDNAYRKVDNGSYTWVYKNQYDKRGGIIMINRINLIYRFGGKMID